jgi:hypothetical protein
MAKRLFTTGNQSYVATAAGTALAAGGQYMALKGGSTTQVIDILEVMISGTATASAVMGMCLSRVSTLETGAASALTNPNSDGPMHTATAALAAPPVAFVDAATTEPTPSANIAHARLQLGLNAFGGIVRWNAAPTQQWTQTGNAANDGESVLSNISTFGGSTTTANAHIMYEPY